MDTDSLIDKIADKCDKWISNEIEHKYSDETLDLLLKLTILKALIGSVLFDELTYFSRVERECNKIVDKHEREQQK